MATAIVISTNFPDRPSTVAVAFVVVALKIDKFISNKMQPEYSGVYIRGWIFETSYELVSSQLIS